MQRPELAPATHPIERLPEEWAEQMSALGEPAYRGKQVFQWIHKRGVVDPEQMTDLSKKLRSALAEEGLGLPTEIALDRPSDDGTRKLLVRLGDGKDVETVLIPQLVDASEREDEDADEDARAGLVPGDVVTQCISSQVGCAMACAFCASGVAGLKRNLSAAEIVSQVLMARSTLVGAQRIRNVVLMGMGEPLHNYEAVARALVLLTHPDGIALSAKRVTLSTSGLVPQIDRLGRDFGGQVALAISLHAPNDATRSAIMPINRKHELAELVGALRRYPLPKRRRITIEYTLLEGLNDADSDADALVALLAGVPFKVNLIPMNPVAGSPLHAPPWKRVLGFQKRLVDRGVAAFIRRQRGDDIDAACGQLALHGEKARKGRLGLPVVPASSR